MEYNVSDSHYIFYLNFYETLSEDFIKLSAYFKEWDIVLVPVKPKELPNVVNTAQNTIIVITSDIHSYREFTKLKKGFLNYALKSKKVVLNHLSSFRAVNEFLGLQRHGVYQFWRLPLRTQEVVDMMAKYYYEKRSKNKTWPGGKRAKLPQADQG
jgi:hypothetical protein